MSGFRFYETMVGRVTPWSQDTGMGYRDPGALSATLRAGVDIGDLDLFVSRDVPHRSALSIELDIPVLSGRPFVTYAGDFELFRPGVIPRAGRGFHMVYDGFISDGLRVFMLSGRKYLRPGRVFSVWPETTRMNVILRDVTHGGRVDVGEPPAGLVNVDEPSWQRDFAQPRFVSGQVLLTPGALIAQLGSMTAPGGRRPVAMARFVWFFAASLVRIYLLREGR